MKSLRFVQTTDRNINQLQSNISQAVTPVLKNQLVNGILLQNIQLASGSNNVNHGLNRNLVGWVITRMRNGFSQIYDTQDSNSNPSKILTLNSSAAVTVDIYVF